MKFSSLKKMPLNIWLAILTCVFAIVSVVCAINVNGNLHTMLQLAKRMDAQSHRGHITMMRRREGGYILVLNGVSPDECNSTLQEALRERFVGKPGGAWDAIYVNDNQVDVGPANPSSAVNPVQARINAAQACLETGQSAVDVRLVSKGPPAGGQMCAPGEMMQDKDGRLMACAAGQMPASMYGSVTTEVGADGNPIITEHSVDVSECESVVAGVIKSGRRVGVSVNGKTVDADPKTIGAHAHEACTEPGKKLVNVRFEGLTG